MIRSEWWITRILWSLISSGFYYIEQKWIKKLGGIVSVVFRYKGSYSDERKVKRGGLLKRAEGEKIYARDWNNLQFEFTHSRMHNDKLTSTGSWRDPRGTARRWRTGKEKTSRRTTMSGRRRRRWRRCVREWRRDAGRRRGSRTRRAFRAARRKQWRRRGSPIQRGTEHRPAASAAPVRQQRSWWGREGSSGCRAELRDAAPRGTIAVYPHRRRLASATGHRHAIAGMAPPRYTLCRTGPGREASSGATLPGGKATAWSTPLARSEGESKSENGGRKEWGTETARGAAGESRDNTNRREMVCTM